MKVKIRTRFCGLQSRVSASLAVFCLKNYYVLCMNQLSRFAFNWKRSLEFVAKLQMFTFCDVGYFIRFKGDQMSMLPCNMRLTFSAINATARLITLVM